MLHQKPEDRTVEMVVKNKLDFCLSRGKALHQKIINDKEKEAKDRDKTQAASKFARPPTMGELHIDNQTKRETASTDYTPLNMAIHRAPKPPVRQGSAERDLSNHRLSRTDSQISNSSSGSGRTISNSSNGRSQSSPRVGPEATKQVHIVPPQLQHSLKQLQQKESQQHQQQMQRQQSQPTHRPVTQPQPIQRQISQPSRNTQPVPNRTQSNNVVQSQSNVSRHQAQQFQSTSQTQPPHKKHHPQPQLATSQAPPLSRQSSSSSGKSVTLPSNGHNLYKEVNIPTTLQRNDYIREGYKTPAVADRRGCPSPSVIPPPREFQEPSAPSPVPKSSQYDSNSTCAQNSRVYNSASQQPTQSYSRSSSNSGYVPPYPPKMHISNHNQPTSSQSSHTRPTAASAPLTPHDSYTRDTAPKHSKQDIRDILVQDMLKRQGNPALPSSNNAGQESNRPMAANTQPNHTNQYKMTSNYLAKNPPLVDEPLWTPPQQSPFDRGLSHYDKPAYHRQNIYGQVNQASSSRYSNNTPSQSTSLVCLSFHMHNFK